MEDVNRAGGPSPQYQHFIPRFILRGFVEPSEPPRIPDGASDKKAKKILKRAKDNAVIKIIQLPTGELGTRLLRKEFGMINMYRDIKASKQDEIEEKLAELESLASEVIRNARDKFMATPDGKLKLSREKRNCLRRFLFLMKYRNRRFHGRYDCDTIDEYSADDKSKMRAYMKQEKLTSPRDVWRRNLLVFLNVKLDAQKSWVKTLPQLVYPDDAEMFKHHMESSYIAFCRPRERCDEFILTENAYGLSEGPSDVRVDYSTGTTIPGGYTEWHNIAPLSSSLLIVLRSNFLPGGPQGNIEFFRAAMYANLRASHANPEDAGSILQDLPVTRPETSYAIDINNELVWKPGASGWSDDDTFSFSCFPISSRHVQLINTLMLEEASFTDVLTYRSNDAMARTLKGYLEDSTANFKISIDDSSHDFARILKLEKALKALGGTVNVRANFLSEGHMALNVGTVVGKKISLKFPDLIALHGRTCAREGGEDPDFVADVRKASMLMLIAIKTDVELKRTEVKQPETDEVKHNRLMTFMQQPTQVFWLYLKICRSLFSFNLDDYKQQTAPLRVHGPEDVILQHAGSALDRVSLAKFMFRATQM